MCHCQARLELHLQRPEGEASDELEVQVEIPEADSDITGIGVTNKAWARMRQSSSSWTCIKGAGHGSLARPLACEPELPTSHFCWSHPTSGTPRGQSYHLRAPATCQPCGGRGMLTTVRPAHCLWTDRAVCILMTGWGAQRGSQDRGAAEDRAWLRGAETRERPSPGQCLAHSLHEGTFCQ